MPKVSVILNTHHGRKDLCQKAIDSVLNQTFKDFELIVIDDASSDGTEAMVKTYTDKRIKYIHRDTNWGNDTRPKNDGIKASTGEYIALLDSDNTYYPEHLQVLVDGIGDYDVAYGDRLVVDTIQNTRNLGINYDYDPLLLLDHNYIDTSDVIIKRQAIFDIGGFDERYRKYVDWNVWVRLSKNGASFKHIPTIITEYIVHKGMKSLTVKDKTPDGNPVVPMGSGFVAHPEWNPYDVEIVLPYLGETKVPKVGVYSLTMDRLEYSKQSFDSLFRKAGYDFDLLIVDNGSKDGTVKWLQELTPYGCCKKISVIYNEVNKGISKASNQAVEALSDYDIICKFDNDCICLTPGCIKAMMDIYSSNHMIALSPYVEGLKDNPGGAARVEYGKIKDYFLGITKHLGGIFHFVSTKAYQDWRWDEDSPLHGMQDLEFSNYLNSKGYLNAYLEDYKVNHGPDGTSGQYKDYQDYFERRKEEKKHKFIEINTDKYWDNVYSVEGKNDPSYRNNVNMFDKILKDIPLDCRELLDVGCGGGFLLSYLENRTKAKLNGCDHSSKGIEVAKTRTSANLFVASIYKMPQKEYDCVVSSEVLEHLDDIKKAISQLYKITKKDGINIHQLPYLDTIPSKEHLHTYSDIDIKELFTRVGFKVLRCEVIEDKRCVYVEKGETKGYCKVIHLVAKK